MIYLVRSVDTLFSIFFWLIMIRALLSWIRPTAYGKFWGDLNNTVDALTEPILAPIRNALPGGGMGLDLSPIVALFLIQIAQRIVVEVLLRLAAL